MGKQEVVDENHPRYGQVGEYDKRWLIPGSNPGLYCHTVKFNDGKTEQFLAYQIAPPEIPLFKGTRKELNNLTQSQSTKQESENKE